MVGMTRPGKTRGTAGSERREAELRSLNRRRRIGRHRSLVLHWLGQWLRRQKRASVAPLPVVSPGQVGIAFAGHASVLVRYAGLDIACDPMLASRVKGVKRAVRPGLSPADFGDTGLILLSHGHVDHLHRGTLGKLPRSATVVVPPRTARLVSDLGFARVVELDIGQSVQHRGVDIFTAPARHGDRACPALSYLIRGDGPSVYFCGDSGYFSGFAEVGKRYRPDIALLPIGGYAPLSFRDRHMTPLDALYAFEDLKARVMIPIHHGSFALSYEKLTDPARWLSELVRQRELDPFVVQLEPGQSRVFVPPRQRTRTEDDGIPDADWSSGDTGPAPEPPAGDQDQDQEAPAGLQPSAEDDFELPLYVEAPAA
jgi:L-ascorbate metabolism protein UlaG (beta-lactamase superfamily)